MDSEKQPLLSRDLLDLDPEPEPKRDPKRGWKEKMKDKWKHLRTICLTAPFKLHPLLRQDAIDKFYKAENQESLEEEEPE
ncbi:hypothetical protein FQN55_008239 [Onygenales sp. PD_40]|nr:hypothetical protein FQN55_008239 [Onygenales sp. PD_40]